MRWHSIYCIALASRYLGLLLGNPTFLQRTFFSAHSLAQTPSLPRHRLHFESSRFYFSYQLTDFPTQKHFNAFPFPANFSTPQLLEYSPQRTRSAGLPDIHGTKKTSQPHFMSQERHESLKQNSGQHTYSCEAYGSSRKRILEIYHSTPRTSISTRSRYDLT